MSQRELAEHLGVSLGKAHYCLRGLVEKGWVKVTNFRRSHNKPAYLYKLTPQGIAGKARITRRYLASRMREYEALKREIEDLRAELSDEAESSSPRESKVL